MGKLLNYYNKLTSEAHEHYLSLAAADICWDDAEIRACQLSPSLANRSQYVQGGGPGQ